MIMSRTEGKRISSYCTLCDYFRMNVQPDGRWLETCEATGEQLIWIYGGLKKSDNCPFKEVEDE